MTGCAVARCRTRRASSRCGSPEPRRNPQGSMMRDHWLILSVAAYYVIALTARLMVDDAGVLYWLFFPTRPANPVFLDASILCYGSRCAEEGFALYEPNARLNALLGTNGYVFNYPP